MLSARELLLSSLASFYRFHCSCFRPVRDRQSILRSFYLFVVHGSIFLSVGAYIDYSGTGITHLLTGFGRFLQSRGKVQIYWVHLLWMFNVFLFLVLNWWILFRWNSQPAWTFFLFLFVLLSPTIAYLLTVLLIPDPFEEGLDLKQHFFSNHRWFFVLAALLPIIDAVDTLLKGWTHFVAQGSLYVITILLLFGLNVVAVCTRREFFHGFFAMFFLIYILAFIAIDLRLLG